MTTPRCPVCGRIGWKLNVGFEMYICPANKGLTTNRYQIRRRVRCYRVWRLVNEEGLSPERAGAALGYERDPSRPLKPATVVQMTRDHERWKRSGEEIRRAHRRPVFVGSDGIDSKGRPVTSEGGCGCSRR